MRRVSNTFMIVGNDSIVQSRSLFTTLSFRCLSFTSNPPPTPTPPPTPPSSSSDSNSQSPKKSKDQDDGMDHWIRQIQSPPNIITSLRILSTPMVSYWIVVMGQYEFALYGCLVFAASDWIDGWIAREYNMTTVLGTYLDPLADKIWINSLALSLAYVDILPTPLVALWAVRDVILVVGTYQYVAQRTETGQSIVNPGTTPLQVKATTISKVNTAFQFLTIFIGLVQPVYHLHPVLLESVWYVSYSFGFKIMAFFITIVRRSFLDS
jgi:cardiolipin synthase (CMP-forming)